MALDAEIFKNKWMIDNGVDPDALLAGEELMPLGDIAALVTIPSPEGTHGEEVYKDIPGLDDDQRVMAVGGFGPQYKLGTEEREIADEYGIAPYARTGRLDRTIESMPGMHVPGGIPVGDSGFDPQSLDYFNPLWKKGLKPGHMPGYFY